MRASRLAAGILIGAAGCPALLGLRSFRLLGELRRAGVDAALCNDVWLAGLGFAGLALALLAATALRSEWRLKLALAAASAAAVLYASEIGFSWTETRVPARVREKLALLSSLRSRNAYGGVEPVRFVWSKDASLPRSLRVGTSELLPLAGIARRLTVDCKEADAEAFMVYETDEHGFNNPPGLWRAPLQLAVLGDSFTAGSCVAPERNMVARLRERYPGTLGLGMAGNGPLLMLAQLREFLPELRPERVLWCHFGDNDLRDLRNELAHPIARRYLDEHFRQDLAGKQAELDRALDAYYWTHLQPAYERMVRPDLRLGDILSLRAVRSRVGLAFPDPHAFLPTEQELGVFDAVLAQARTEVAAWGGRLYFVYLEGWKEERRHLGGAAVAGLEARLRARTLASARALGLPIIDLARAFGDHEDPEALFACPGCHYSAAGYAFAARAVMDALGAGDGTALESADPEPEQVGDHAQAPRPRAEAAIAVVAPAHADLLDAIARLRGQQQQLEIEEVSVDPLATEQIAGHLAAEELQAALNVADVAQTQQPMHRSRERERAEAPVERPPRLETGSFGRTGADHKVPAGVEPGKQPVELRGGHLAVGVHVADQPASRVADALAHPASLSAPARCAEHPHAGVARRVLARQRAGSVLAVGAHDQLEAARARIQVRHEGVQGGVDGGCLVVGGQDQAEIGRGHAP